MGENGELTPEERKRLENLYGSLEGAAKVRKGDRGSFYEPNTTLIQQANIQEARYGKSTVNRLLGIFGEKNKRQED